MLGIENKAKLRFASNTKSIKRIFQLLLTLFVRTDGKFLPGWSTKF